jgi:hypothetical protein
MRIVAERLHEKTPSPPHTLELRYSKRPRAHLTRVTAQEKQRFRCPGRFWAVQHQALHGGRKRNEPNSEITSNTDSIRIPAASSLIETQWLASLISI